ncbi:MAG: hypothetical protein Q4D62_10425 [Planctomycetia bacterium]|nr:hypothetical protein [Planctomycetia bacterium]
MRELQIILPSQSLETLNLDYSERENEEILTAWTSVYHPDVLRATREVAKPLYGLYVFDEPIDTVLLMPSASRDVLNDDWIERAKQRNCVFLTDFSDREALIQTILTEIEAEKPELATSPSEEPAVEDFLALGLVHLFSDILSHRLQYMSYLESYDFRNHLLESLSARDSGDASRARQEMQSAWDLLVQSRQYYAPSDGYLFDLLLLAPEVLSEKVGEEWETTYPKNLLTDAATLEQMAKKFPAQLEKLRQCLESKKGTLLGGEWRETELPLLSQEGILQRLKQGLEQYEKTLGIRPAFFGRRRFGLTPMLPQILKGLDFQGALHSTLDDGLFPVGDQTRIAWQGLGSASLESIAKIPLRADQAESLCQLPRQYAQTLHTDNAFGTLFAHWPGKKNRSHWYDLLVRSTQWTPVLGSLATMEECLETTRYSSTSVRFRADQYVSPYLVQGVLNKEPDVLSRWVRYHQTRVRLESLRLLEGMYRWMTWNQPLEEKRMGKNASRKEIRESRQNAEETTSRVQELLLEMDTSQELTPEFYAAAQVEIHSLQKQLAEKMAHVLADGKKNPNALLVLNPWSFTSRKTVNLTETEQNFSLSRLCPLENRLCVKQHIWEKNATNRNKPTHAAVLDIPPMGFAILTDHPEGTEAPSEMTRKRTWLPFRKSSPTPPPAYHDTQSNTWIMTNEFLELRFDAFTGHLRAVYDNIHRGNRFSQQLGMRLKPSPLDSLEDEDGDHYSIQAADDIRTVIFADRSELHVTGRLMGRQGELLSHFTQTTILRRGHSMIEWDIYLQPQHLPGKNPWQSYYASRFVWGDMAADLFRNVGFQTVPTQARRLEAPYFIDVRPVKIDTTTRVVSTMTKNLAESFKGQKLREEDFFPERDEENVEYTDSRITILTNGLPYHRWIGMRKLDSLLLVQGETSRHFRLGVSFDTPYPMQNALKFMAPPIQTGICHSASSFSWCGHVSHRNILITHWEPTAEGAKIRLIETEGRRVKATFQALHDISHAEETDFLGNSIRQLSVEKGKVHWEMEPYGFLEIRLTFVAPTK